MPSGFPLQDTGPGMNELFHDLAVEQDERKVFTAGRCPTCHSPDPAPHPSDSERAQNNMDANQ